MPVEISTLAIGPSALGRRFAPGEGNTVKSCFQGYVLLSPKTLYFFLEKKAVNTVSGLFLQSNQFLLQTIYQGQNSDPARMRTAVDAYI